MSKNIEFFKVNSDHYFFLWRFALRLFLRLCVATLCLLRFLPLGICKLYLNVINYFETGTLDLTPLTKILAGLKEGIL